MKNEISIESVRAMSVAFKEMQGEFDGRPIIRIDPFADSAAFRREEKFLRNGGSPYDLIHEDEVTDLVA